MTDARPGTRRKSAATAGRAAPAQPPTRVMVEGVRPEVDCGRFPVKRVVRDALTVEADVFTEGHDAVAAVLRWREGEGEWQESAMEPLGNDRWRGSFVLPRLGLWEYTVEGWIDAFGTWRAGLAKKVEAGQDVSSELLEGAELLRAAADRAAGPDAADLREAAGVLGGSGAQDERVKAALAEAVATAARLHPDRTRAARYDKALRVEVERERAAVGAWYEFFPRSASPEPGRHGTLRDAADRLSYVAAMGFDVVYLPPVHPIGRAHRKGPNNNPVSSPGDPGSPWGIGADEGGHTAVHPELGTLEDFDRFVRDAAALDLEVALDIAFQTAPDHPWVREHPEWFRHRPDGTIQYAENPPKKYQDIYPLHFENPDWRGLWAALRDVVLFWVEHGVRIFRVDNPHTKPFAFWEWMIREVRNRHPDVVFLSEAFTRPRVMEYLAKVGFSQSYTYFTWRNTRAELEDYLTELTQTEVSEYLRPNFFVNTPDILHEYLQNGGRAASRARLVLAATLTASYGVYGPAFELVDVRGVPGTEEYLDSEKYQVRWWDLDQPGSLRDFITRVNAIRRDNAAFHRNGSLRFHPVDNPALIAYSKVSGDGTNLMLVVVNLDPHRAQQGWVTLALDDLGIDTGHPYQVHDLLGDARYLWHGPVNYVALEPTAVPAHIFRVRRRLRTEQDFDYYL